MPIRTLLFAAAALLVLMACEPKAPEKAAPDTNTAPPPAPQKAPQEDSADGGSAAAQPKMPPQEAEMPQPEAPKALEASALVEGNTRFALNLYSKLAKEDGNIAFSPLSISIALAMTEAGARETTDAQMRNVLELPEGDPHPGFQALLSQLKPGEDATFDLALANRLWSAHSLELQKAFVELTGSRYSAPIERLNFGDSEAARSTINSWISEQTRDLIPELIPSGVLSGDTRLVLTNAIYFKGSWAYTFKEENTSEQDFFAPSGTVKAPLMQQTRELKLAQTDDVALLELPYEGDDLSMLVLLPAQNDGLPALEASLTPEMLAQLSQSARNTKVKVWLPRFKAESDFELSTVLKSMGMTDAFMGKANFQGIHVDPRESLFISAVIHKAFVEVNEEGSEAAAATAVVMARGAGRPKPPPEFRADHPFLYLIRDNRTQSLLFMGRMLNPTE